MMSDLFEFMFDEKDLSSDFVAQIDKYLYNNGEVFLDADVDQETIGVLIRKIKSLSKNNPKQRIKLHINSDGGEVYEFLRLYDFIRSIPNKVDTVVEGKAMSAGALIGACCATGKRCCHKNSTYMLHEISTGTIGNLAAVKNDIDEAERLQKKIIELLSKHTKLTKKDFDYVKHNDYYMDAKEAKKKGLVDTAV